MNDPDFEKFKKIIEEQGFKIELTHEERDKIRIMMDFEKKSQDPDSDYWKYIILGGGKVYEVHI